MFANLRDLNYDKENISKEIRKIATFQSPQDINQALNKLLVHQHSPDYINRVIEEESLNAEVVYQNDNFMAVDVKDHPACIALGSSQWCIVTSRDVFADYLFSDDDERYTLYPGNQVIFFNFDLDRSNPEHMIGITFSPAGNIIASHDKNDVPVDFPHSTYTLNFIDKHIVGNLKSNTDNLIEDIKHDCWMDGSYFESDFFERHTRNPLNAYIKAYQQYDNWQDFFDNETHIDISPSLIHKSYTDFTQFQSIDTKTMIEDYLSFYRLVQQINDFQNNLDDDHSFVFNIPTSKEVLESMEYQFVFNTIESDLQRHLIFKDNEQLIIDLALEQLDILDYDVLQKSFQKSTPNFPNLNASVFDHFIPEVLSHSQQHSDIESLTLCIKHCFNNYSPKSWIEDQFVEAIENNSIHINKYLANQGFFSMNMQDKIISALNNGPEIIQDMRSDILVGISVYPDFIEQLNTDVKRSMNQSIKDNALNIGEIKPPKHGMSDFLKNMTHLKNNGIIDNDIIKKHGNEELKQLLSQKQHRLKH